jgi:hypothetical protein
MLASLGLRLKQHYQIFNVRVFVKKTVFEQELIKTKQIAISVKS